MQSNRHGDWILLTEQKQRSRLLYTNPVCFLCCSARDNTTPTATSPVVGRHNAMVLSWLTPMNNTGGFVMSLNRRRHSVSMLQQSDGEEALFTLSVPIHGMEELVRLVGSTSGRHGNKFAEDLHLSRDSSHSLPGPADPASCTTCTSPMNAAGGGLDRVSPGITAAESSVTVTSKRQLKKRLRTMGVVPGLKAVPAALYEDQKDSLVCIQGTVAHLVCRVMSTVPGIDYFDRSRAGSVEVEENASHILFIAQVEHASVRSMYWDSHKNLFRPSPHIPPYLSFFGSQIFGYVVTQDSLPAPSDASPTSTDLALTVCHP
jgi:flavin reductase (DIM6/NTAB) family NADH-FMN oxidoreductase RutF